MIKSESIANLAAALSAFQNEVKQPLKDKKNPFFNSKYVPLENIVEVINNTAHSHGLSFIQYPTSSESKVGIVTVLMHNSGEFIQTEPVYVTPKNNDPQSVGSAITYLKRYSLSAVFGITSDEDDDGNQATHAAPKRQDAITAKQKTEISQFVNSISKKTGMSITQVYNSSSKAALGIEKQTKDLTSNEAEKIIKHLSTFE